MWGFDPLLILRFKKKDISKIVLKGGEMYYSCWQNNWQLYGSMPIG